MRTIVDDLNRLVSYQTPIVEHECTAKEVADAICRLLGETCLKDDDECDRLTQWEEAISKLRCEILGGHSWTYDMCGYWGHQFCQGCAEFKYPELASLRCSEAIELTKNSLEEDYKSKI